MPKPPPITVEDASRLGRLLRFAPSVAAQFEVETAADRVRHLRRTIVIGLLFYNSYNLTALVVMPDVARLALLLRLGVVTPISLWIAWRLSRMSAARRETTVLLGMLGVVSVPVLLLCLSHSPYATYAASQTFLAMVFATMLLMLRFPHALIFVAVTVLMAVPSYYLRPGNPPLVAHELALEMLSAACFVLYGNYRLERSTRSSYLRVTRASLRSADLQVDKTALERLSLVDPLTGIANRRGLSERLKAWRADTSVGERALAIVMVDVDHFKRYNDHYGHPAGDLCLQAIAQAMAACLRDERDLLARYGGEEFAVMLPGADAEEACAVAERLCKAVAALGMPHTHRDDGSRVVTISAGVASANASRRRARALFEAADAALYRAKQAGRNRHVASAPLTSPPVDAAPSDVAPLGEHGVSDMAPLVPW